MFVLTERDAIWWPVTIKIPRGDGSKKFDTFKCKLKFKLLNRTELSKIQESDEPVDIADYILDWDEIVDSEGNPVPFSRELLEEKFLNNLHITKCVMDAFREANAGADTKN